MILKTLVIDFLFWCLFFVRIFCLQKINSTIIKVQKLFTFDLPYFWFWQKEKNKKGKCYKKWS